MPDNENKNLQSRRDALSRLDLNQGANASLLMARYLEKNEKGEGDKPAKKAMHTALRTACQNVLPLYEEAYKRRKAALETLPTRRELPFQTATPLVVGLGNENVLEAGLTLEHTYGVPIIPASSIKGIAASWCATVLGPLDPSLKRGGATYVRLFGSDSEDSIDEQTTGALRFFDAWITPQTLTDSLRTDILTPHHGDYYTGSHSDPTDFDSPVPFTFLTVLGQFDIAVQVLTEDNDPETADKWLDFVFSQILVPALKHKGIGGKLSSGYGRMVNDACEQQEEQRRKEAEAQAKQAQKDAKLAELGYPQKDDIIEVRCKDIKTKDK